MKFYSLAIASSLAYASANNYEAARCPADLPCSDAIASLVNTNNGRRRRETTQGAVISKSTLHGILDTKGVVCNKDNDSEACRKQAEQQAQMSEAPRSRFGLKVQVPVINNYGCWCYGGEFWPGARDLTGFGPHMDQYDDACKAHHQGFDCITMDANAEGESCIPNEQDYLLKVTPQANGDYLLECADEIENHWCKRRTCMVDLRFLARHWKLEADDVIPDYATYGHAGFHNDVGDFDTATCELPKPPHVPGNGGHRAVKVCCGDYPYRVWYDKTNFRSLEC